MVKIMKSRNKTIFKTWFFNFEIIMHVHHIHPHFLRPWTLYEIFVNKVYDNKISECKK